MMITLAQQSKIEVVSFFWSPFMFGQLTYDASYASMTPSQILDAGNRVAYDSLYRFRFSSIGMYTKNAIAIVNGGITPAPEGSELPESFVLEQNYPNPFNPTTTIRFGLPSQSQVSLIILDVLGREVAELVDGMKEAGQYSVEWNATGVASGVYFARFVAMDLSGNAKIHGVKKLLLAR